MHKNKCLTHLYLVAKEIYTRKTYDIMLINVVWYCSFIYFAVLYCSFIILDSFRLFSVSLQKLL